MSVHTLGHPQKILHLFFLISNVHTTRSWQLADTHDFYLELSVNSIDSEHWSQFTCEDEILWWDHMLTVFSRPHVAMHTYRVWQATANNTVTDLCTDLYNSLNKILVLGTSYQCEVASTCNLPIKCMNKDMTPSLYYHFFVLYGLPFSSSTICLHSVSILWWWTCNLI